MSRQRIEKLRRPARPYGAISCRIIANKLSSFSYAQDLCNGVFAFKIGQKLTEHEARKDDLVQLATLIAVYKFLVQCYNSCHNDLIN